MAVEDSRIFSFNVTNATSFQNDTKYSNVLFQIPKFITRHRDHTAVYISIENATLPSSWYNVPSGTTISFFRGDTGTTSSYTIPAGNYDAFTLCTAINTNWTAFTALGLKISYSISYNSLGFSWTIAGPFPFVQVYTSNSYIFGQGDVSLTVAGSATATTYFPKQMNLTGVNLYLIVCDEAPTQNYSLQLSGNIIGSIQNAAANFGVTIWQNQSNLRYLVPTNRQIDQITIRIYNERGELIDFNGVSWSLTIKITYLKDKGASLDDLNEFIHKINRVALPESKEAPDAQSEPSSHVQQPESVP
jgi:hypothetical protein